MAPVVERRKKIQFAKGNVYEGKPFEGVRWTEPKYDGLRGAVLDTEVAVTLTGLDIPNAALIVKELADSGQFEGMVLDGEFLADDWNLSQSIVKSQKPHPEVDKLNFRVFDMLTVDEWNSKTCTRTLTERKQELTKRLKAAIATVPHVYLTPHTIVRTELDIRVELDEHVLRGFEGIMIKDPDSTYSFKKNNDWLKAKPVNEGDFFITGAFVGRGKQAGMLGALQIMNEELNVECEVGTGFDDATRIQLWTDFNSQTLIGRICQVEYQEVTEDNSLRFPSFVRMRDDKL